MLRISDFIWLVKTESVQNRSAQLYLLRANTRQLTLAIDECFVPTVPKSVSDYSRIPVHLAF
jgi:hypothetical protein